MAETAGLQLKLYDFGFFTTLEFDNMADVKKAWKERTFNIGALGDYTLDCIIEGEKRTFLDVNFYDWLYNQFGAMPSRSEILATQYAEKHGITDYTIKEQAQGSFMLYSTSHPSARKEDRATYKIKVDLNKGKETARTKLSRYYKKHENNLYL